MFLVKRKVGLYILYNNFYYIRGPRGFLILGESVGQNVALYKGGTRSRASFSLSERKVTTFRAYVQINKVQKFIFRQKASICRTLRLSIKRKKH